MTSWSLNAGCVLIMLVESDDSVIILRSRSGDGVMIMYVESNGFVISLW